MKKRQKTTTTKHPTNTEVQRIEKDIRTLRDNNKSSTEIQEILGIELRTYQRYIHKIQAEDKQIWYDIASQELESELLRLRSCLNHSYNIAKKMSEDETADISERLEACQAANDCRLSLVQILQEYPYFISRRKEAVMPRSEETPTTLKRIH